MLRSVADFLLSVLAVFLIAGTALPPGAVASNSVTDIAFQSSAPYYEPSVAVVPMGTLIRWVNTTASFHSVRHDACVDDEPCPFQSIAIPPDSSFVVAPLPPGRYAYHCELHPIMRGTLLVVEPSSMDAARERRD
jgi:plastocyanin